MWYKTEKLAKEVEALKAQTANLPPEMREERFREEAEKGWQKIQDCILSFKAGSNILTGGRFDTLSLGTWNEIVKAAGVRSVPMYIVGLLDFMEVIMTQFEPVPIQLDDGMKDIPGMVRLDFGGSQALKMNFGVRGERYTYTQGDPPIGTSLRDGTVWFEFDDRTVHGFMEYIGQIGSDGNTKTPIWWRPWVQAQQIAVPRPEFMRTEEVDYWPLEWRVIVQAGKVAGISPYYIQAPVEDSTEIETIVADVRAQSEKILTYMAQKKIQPWHTHYIDEHPEDDVSFVIDFISTEKHGLLFLEAGPAVPVDENNVPVETRGAHPCCFLGHKIEGVRLSK